MVSRKLPALLVVVRMLNADVIFMPRLQPLVVLGESWLVGEVVAVLLRLLPAIALARSTEADQKPVLRTCFHALGWGGYMLLVLPACVLAWEGGDYIDAIAHASQPRWALALLIGSPSLLIGWAAAHEFALVGRGTPIPYDPSKRVVTSDPYASIANPMQLTSALVMAALAILTASNAAWSLPITFLIFDGVFASWYNRAHIALAMPDDWERYRAEVRDRRFRHRPHVARTATLHFPDAGRDSRVLAWLKRRVADRLEIQIAPAPPRCSDSGSSMPAATPTSTQSELPPLGSRSNISVAFRLLLAGYCDCWVPITRRACHLPCSLAAAEHASGALVAIVSDRPCISGLNLPELASASP